MNNYLTPMLKSCLMMFFPPRALGNVHELFYSDEATKRFYLFIWRVYACVSSGLANYS
jgi:hypothetical protein